MRSCFWDKVVIKFWTHREGGISSSRPHRGNMVLTRSWEIGWQWAFPLLNLAPLTFPPVQYAEFQSACRPQQCFCLSHLGEDFSQPKPRQSYHDCSASCSLWAVATAGCKHREEPRSKHSCWTLDIQSKARTLQIIWRDEYSFVPCRTLAWDTRRWMAGCVLYQV